MPRRALRLLLGILLPPVGLVLLWRSRETGVFKKVLGSLLLAAVAVAELIYVVGFRVDRYGTGMPTLSYGTTEAHYAALERDRAQQQAAAPAPTPAPTAAPAAAPPPAAKPAGWWTDFRGPLRDGVYTEAPVIAEWPSNGLRPLWKQPCGGGYASFVVGEGKAFTIEQRRDKEFVAAYDLETGREQWTHSYPAFFQESMGGDGPRATPTYHEGMLYSLGATGELRCLDAASGKVKWAKNILSDNAAENVQWGMAAAPLVVDEKLIVLPGGRGASVVAYNKLTGKKLWGALDDKAAYTSPMLVTLAGRRQILVVTAKRAVGLTPEAGELLWEYPWVTEYDVNSAQPVIVDANRFVLSAGYGHGAALVEIRGEGPRYTARTVWENNRMKNKFSSSVLRDGHLYGLDESILACMDARTGDLKWKGGRYGYGQVLLAGDRLIVITETGELALVRATPERHQELARFSAIDGKTWNVPALDGGRLLVRNTTEMACFRVGR